MKVSSSHRYGDFLRTLSDTLYDFSGNNQIHGKLNQGAFHFEIAKDESWESPETEESSSQASENIETKDYNQYLDLLNEFEEDEEPLQRYSKLLIYSLSQF